jgi:TatD DNase family protein
MPPLQLIDTHCHLNSPLFAGREAAVLKRAEDAGVTRCLAPGWDEASSRRAVALAEQYPQVFAAVGLHPLFLEAQSSLEWLLPLATHPRVVAVGEIGIDPTARVPLDAQRTACRFQLELAQALGMPVLLHCRSWWGHLIEILGGVPVRGVAHGFSGSPEMLAALLARGVHIGVGALATRQRAHRAHAAIIATPRDRLLLETDSPFQRIMERSGQAVEPGHLPLVLDAVAALRGETGSLVGAQTRVNTELLFTELSVNLSVS